MKSREGLTLIEVILSIAIIGIILVTVLGMFSIGIKNIFSAGNKTRDVLDAQTQIDNFIKNPEKFIANPDKISEIKPEVVTIKSIKNESGELPKELDINKTINVSGKVLNSDNKLKTFVPDTVQNPKDTPNQID